MPSIPALLQQIPDEFKPAAALGIGALILVILVIFHGISLHKILIHFKRRELRLQAARPHLWGAAFLFGWAIFMMLTLHIVEIMAWAMALHRLGLIVHPADAIYFCANAYTTMGYGAVDLSTQWRNITAVIAISGLFTFAWTTSSLVTMVANYMKIVEQLELERMKELDLRSNARHAEWEAINKERDAERQERLATRKIAGTLSFFDRRKLWREEKQKEEQLRQAAQDEVQHIRVQERADEEKLGQDFPDDSGVKK
ncbi:MAG TPA: ion channel [Bradyrhizobium sp.]|nr:ion channel [Bradyrhizobium sp.]